MYRPSDVTAKSKYFLYIAIMFVAVLMISNTVSGKLIQIGSFIFPGAIIIFPVSYIFGDILTEVYGYRASRKVIWAGFLALVLMTLCYFVVEILPAPGFWKNQAAYETILGSVPRIVLASMVAYLVGEFANSYVLSLMKVKSMGRHLWMRTIGSTVVGEGLDTVIFGLIAFAGTMPSDALISLILSVYIAKVLYEVLLTPVTYRVVAALKRAEGIDTYDSNLSYNPFALKG